MIILCVVIPIILLGAVTYFFLSKQLDDEPLKEMPTHNFGRYQKINKMETEILNSITYVDRLSKKYAAISIQLIKMILQASPDYFDLSPENRNQLYLGSTTPLLAHIPRQMAYDQIALSTPQFAEKEICYKLVDTYQFKLREKVIREYPCTYSQTIDHICYFVLRKFVAEFFHHKYLENPQTCPRYYFAYSVIHLHPGRSLAEEYDKLLETKND